MVIIGVGTWIATIVRTQLDTVRFQDVPRPIFVKGNGLLLAALIQLSVS